MIEGSEFPHLMRGERVLLSSEGVRIGDEEGRETEEGNLYVTNMRLIFHGKPASFSKNIKKGGKGLTTLSFLLENVGNIRALRDSKELELEYHMDSRFSSLACSKVILKGLTETQIGRIILLLEEFKREAPSPPEIPQERRPQGVLGRILEIINPDEGKEKTGGKHGAKQISLGVSEAVSKRKKEEKTKKEEEDLLRIPPGLEVEGEVELVCPACGEWIRWKPGMLVCPVCRKKMNPFTGKVID